jgi:hypothetical protein
MWAKFAALVAVLVVTGCASDTSTAVSSSPPVTATTTTAAVLTGGPSGLGPGEEVCKISGDGGSYYLQVTSRTENDLSECAPGTPVQTTVGQLMDTVKGFDRRCLYDGTNDPSVHAIVAVYSAADDADENAALGQCLAHKATDY